MWGSVSSSVSVSNVILSDNGIGVHYGIGDSASPTTSDKRFTLFDSTIVGISDNTKCEKHKDYQQPLKHDRWSFSSYSLRIGLMLATFSDNWNSMIPFKKPWIHTQASYQTAWGPSQPLLFC